MQTIAFAPPVLESQPHLTPLQQGLLRANLGQRLQSQRDRAVQATIMLQEFSDARSSTDRKIARRQLMEMVEDARRLENALERMDTGDYGACVNCARLIPFERLEAVPEARYCRSCLRT